jgi:hypothetical protein
VANAFLLGLDLWAIATNHDTTYIERFLQHFLKRDEEKDFNDDDFSARTFRSQIRALKAGFREP